MAMHKKKGMARGGMKKKGYARGGATMMMKKKGMELTCCHHFHFH